MQRVHYFQRFSRPEDVATNNTMLLLKRIQHHDPRLFQGVLREVLADNDLTVGAELTEQETIKNSIADGVIRQRSFHVVIETKLHASFDIGQLRQHLGAFKETHADLEVMLLLGKQEAANFGAAQEAVAIFNERHKKAVRSTWTTFASLIETCRDIMPEHEREMHELLDDYEDFCDGADLLASSDADLLVVGCSQSMPDNLELRLYYDSKMSHRPAKYIGFYSNKSVRAVGLLERVARVDLEGGALKVFEGSPLTSDQEGRVREAMKRAPEHGWNIDKGCYFFLAADVHETNYRKATKYPLWSRRYFDLREVLSIEPKEKLPDVATLANRLLTVTW